MDKISAIILAAGSGNRMKEDFNKLFIPVNGKPILAHTLSNFVDLGLNGEILVVLNPKDYEDYNRLIKEPYGFENVRIIEGGETRSQSSYKGLKALESDTDYVMIHDGARPFTSKELLEDNIETVKRYGSAVPAISVTSTVKVKNKDGTIESTPERDTLIEAQTPQSFSYQLIKDAYDNLKNTITTDDSSILEEVGIKPHLSKGSRQNIKITTPDDLIIAEAIANSLYK